MIPTRPYERYYITEESKVDWAVNILLSNWVLGFDLETYHPEYPRVMAFDPTAGARMSLALFSTPKGQSFVFDLFKVDKRFLYKLFPNPYLVVGQNLKFDFKFLTYELGIDEFGDTFDTMIAGQLNTRGNVAGQDRIPVSLASLAQRELKITVDKDEQASDWGHRPLSESQLDYAFRDSMVPLALWERQIKQLRNDGQIAVAEVEFNAIPAIGDIELNGIRLNGPRWMAEHEKTQLKAQELKSDLWKELAIQESLFDDIATLNVDSQPQVIYALEKRNVPVPIDPKTGHKSLDAKLIRPMLEHYPILKKYREYKKHAKSLQAYGPAWLKLINPADGRIHATVRQIGAETGRSSFAKPNLQQIKKEDNYRNCFEADEGWVLVDADYSQCELRILAEYCRDENFLRAFDEGYDLHRYTASLIFQCAMDAVDSIMRGIAKNLNFGIVYGIGVLKFSVDAGIPLEEAKRIMNYYLYEAYPGMSLWLNEQAARTISDMQARTMTGRIRQYKGNLAEDGVKAQIERNGKNLPIQGTNGDITKRALYLVYNAIRPYRKHIKIIHVIHDEIILEAKPEYALQAKELLTTCMLMAEREYLKRVPSVVDCSITKVWTKEATEEQLKEAELMYA